jgi:hypothetical protein
MPYDGVDLWAKTQTIASVLGLTAVLLTVATLINERLQRRRKQDVGSIAADQSAMGYFYVNRVSTWSTFQGKSTEVTTVAGPIEAGDLYQWSSAVFDRYSPHFSKVCWVSALSTYIRRGRDAGFGGENPQK